LLFGTFRILAIGGFLISKSFQSNTGSLTVVGGIIADQKKASPFKGSEGVKDALPLTSEKNHRSNVRKETMLLTTENETIRIELCPDLSPKSPEYIHCNLYWVEKGVLHQGVMAFPDAKAKFTKGKCPPKYKDAKPGRISSA
jgi:hypothetical protein